MGWVGSPLHKFIPRQFRPTLDRAYAPSTLERLSPWIDGPSRSLIHGLSELA